MAAWKSSPGERSAAGAARAGTVRQRLRRAILRQNLQDHPSACGTKLATDFGGGEHWLLVPQDSTAQDRLNEATTVFTEIMGTREKGIPEELLGKAHCIVIIPG